jgi:branched-chain amino acid transport system substrate-binding protein
MAFRKTSHAVPVLVSGLVLCASAQAQISGNVVKIGVLNDQSSLYADATGPGSVVAALNSDDGTKVVAKK